MINNSSNKNIALHNLYTVSGSLINELVISNDIIKGINNSTLNKENISLYFNDALVFPGLINSHDHLDFNLFPRLGNRVYNNYVEWGNDIHQQNKTIIDEVLKVPQILRTQWGVYKNLFNGVTTVFNHGKPLQIKHPLIDVCQDKNALHSVQLEKNWKQQLLNPFNIKEPYVIHIGEGTDAGSYDEIDSLIKWNLFHKPLIGIHAVAMKVKQAAAFKAIVWCPDSNFFLLNTTAAIDKLKHITTIVFGTDSTVSADWNIWNQLRLANTTGLLSADELIASLTTSPAKLRHLDRIGVLQDSALADIVIAEKKSADAMNSFLQLNPEMILMIIKNGDIILFDESMLQQLTSQKINTHDFERVSVTGKVKYVKGNIHKLITHIQSYSKDIVLPVEAA